MPKLKPPLIASIGALLLVGALFLSLFLSTAAYRTEDDVVLPSETTKAPESDAVLGQNLEILGDVQVTASNVQRVIASLSRAESYTATIVSRLYYGETSGTVTCRQTVKNGAYRTDYLDAEGTIAYTELLWNGSYYTWRNGADTYSQGNQGAFTTDQSAMLPTYETVCDLPEEQITGGALVQEGDELLLTVDTQNGNQIGVYKVSARTGLLRSASFSENGKMTRAVDVQVSTEEPADSLFVLPGETTPVYQESQNQS